MVQPHSRILHLEGLSHSRSGEGGLKRYQSVNLEKLRQRWRPVLMTEQMTDHGLPLLASDRGLRRGPVVLLLGLGLDRGDPPSAAVAPSLLALINAFQKLGFKVLLLHEPACLQPSAHPGLEERGVICVPAGAAGDGLGWLLHQVPWLDVAVDLGSPGGADLRETLCNHYPDAHWLEVESLGLENQPEERHSALLRSRLPERIQPRPLRVPPLTGTSVVCRGVELLASSQGVHPDGWLEVESLLVLALAEAASALRLDLYLPEECAYANELTVRARMGWDPAAQPVQEYRMHPGITTLHLSVPDQQLHAGRELCLRLEGSSYGGVPSRTDQRRLFAVLVSLMQEG
jgi:hypothetical protein